MVRWSYGYRYLLAPENGYQPDLEHQDQDQDHHLHRHPTMESDENTPLLRHDPRPVDERSSNTSRSDSPSTYEFSTSGIPPIVPGSPVTNDAEDEDITSYPPLDEYRPKPWYIRLRCFLRFLWQEFLEFMNMPLWAMVVAVVIALYPKLQYYLFYQKNGFIRGSVIYAIQTCGDVSIPLILVILGANLANEDPPTHEDSPTDPVVDRKWSLTQRQRSIILGVANRMIIVPVTSLFFLMIWTNWQVDYLPVNYPRCVTGCKISHGCVV